jgi:hypothetical protein
VAKLCLPPGAAMFAARAAYRLAYWSQRVTALDRSHHRQRRLYRQFGANYESFEQTLPARPKGMHRKTYARLTDELYSAMATHNELFALHVAPPLARLMRSDAAGRRCHR